MEHLLPPRLRGALGIEHVQHKLGVRGDGAAGVSDVRSSQMRPCRERGRSWDNLLGGTRWCWAQCRVGVLLCSGVCSDAGILSKEVPPAPPKLCVSQIQARDGDRGATNPHPRDPDSWEHTPWQHLLMLGGSILESEVPWSLSHARAVGCSSVVSLRTSRRPLAMEEIFSFWAAARFSKKRALQDGVDVGQKQSRDGDNRDNQQTTPHHTAQPVPQHRNPLHWSHHIADTKDSTSSEPCRER